MHAKKVPELDLPEQGSDPWPPSPKLSDDAYAQWTQYMWKTVVNVKRARAEAERLRVNVPFVL